MIVLYNKLKEVLMAVSPIVVIVLILHFTITPLESSQLYSFLTGSVMIILGLTIFLFGVDLGISAIGRYIGGAVVKKNSFLILVFSGLLLGFMISVAEPDLHILAGQVDIATGGVLSKLLLVVMVSFGIAIMLALGFIRIVYNISIKMMFLIIYGVILVGSILASKEFIAIAFDASGATTGAMTVPFMLSLAMGISVLRKDSKSSEADSFGLVGLASAGAIIAVLAISIFSRSMGIESADMLAGQDGRITFFGTMGTVAGEILMALLPITLVFFMVNKNHLKLSKMKMRSIGAGVIYTYIGLVLFLTGVNTGFMDVGRTVGYEAVVKGGGLTVIIVGFMIGFVTILAEPAVYILTHQIEEVTSGFIKRKSVMGALSIGVGMSVALSMARIMIGPLELWHILLPGYIIGIGLMYFVPDLFVGIAFDSGGVASGPMTATFILAFAQGAASAAEGADVLADGFGVIAMVAMTPVIALQILGYIFKLKSKKVGVADGSS
ncbi:MAG: DUF1538 domain-containing protein [Gudongella sp.]|nr:DUF1538 domain-containing protein [Gudongella sp.]